MTWVGKVITPIFLVFLTVLVVIALAKSNVSINTITPSDAYVSNSFINGLLEGYNTMDAIAGLAFGIIVVNCIRDLGIHDGKLVAIETIKAGSIAAVLMSIIYIHSGRKPLSL